MKSVADNNGLEEQCKTLQFNFVMASTTVLWATYNVTLVRAAN